MVMDRSQERGQPDSAGHSGLRRSPFECRVRAWRFGILNSSVFVPTCGNSKLCMSAACRGGFLDDDERARREFHHRDTEAAKVRKGKLGFLMRGTRLTVFPPWTTIPTAWREEFDQRSADGFGTISFLFPTLRARRGIHHRVHEDKRRQGMGF